MEELFEEKMKVVLERLRSNNTGDDALKYTQAVDNLARARKTWFADGELESGQNTGTKPPKKLGAGA